jgi:hypothetical protein
MLLKESGELNGGNIFKSIGKSVSKSAKSVGKETKNVFKKVDKYATPVVKKARHLGLISLKNRLSRLEVLRVPLQQLH